MCPSTALAAATAGRGQVHLARRVAHTADEVAVRGGDGALARGEDAHVAAQARAARGRGHGAVRVHEHLHQALLHALAVDLLRGGDDDAAHVGMHLAPAQHVGGLAHVGDAAVRAGADDGLVDAARRAPRPPGACSTAGAGTRPSAGWCAASISYTFAYCGVRVGMVLGVGALRAAVHIGARHVVHLDEAGLAARLDGHVRDASCARPCPCARMALPVNSMAW